MKAITVIILMLVLSYPCYSINTEEIMNNMSDTVNNKVETFKADIEQVVFISEMEGGTKLKGSITLKKQNKIFIDYNDPVKQSVISDGKSVWLYFPEQKQVIAQNIEVMKNKDNILFTLNKFVEFIKNKYDSKYIKEEKIEDKDYYMLECSPKSQSEEFVKINVWVSKEKWIPMIIDGYVNEVSKATITFKNEIINEEVKDEIFDFKVPDDVDVVSSPLE